MKTGIFWNKSYPKSWGKLFERYISEHFPDEKKEILGGDCCDYWYVGDKSPVLREYEGLKKI